MLAKVLAAAVAALFLVACGTDEPAAPNDDAAVDGFDEPISADAEAYPVLVSSEIVVGDNRFLIGVLNGEDAPIGSPEIDVSAEFFLLEQSSTMPVTSAEFEFVESVPGERGFFVGHVTFPDPGEWGAEVSITADGIDEEHKVA